jgi:hypothetical protein
MNDSIDKQEYEHYQLSERFPAWRRVIVAG